MFVGRRAPQLETSVTALDTRDPRSRQLRLLAGASGWRGRCRDAQVIQIVTGVELAGVAGKGALEVFHGSFGLTHREQGGASVVQRAGAGWIKRQRAAELDQRL